MKPDQLRMLIALARAGFATRAENMPTDKLREATSAIAAGEAWMVVLEHQPPAPAAGSKAGD